MSSKRAILLGGTGAIGTYLAPELVKQGFSVDITSRSRHDSPGDGIRYVEGDALNLDFLTSTLKEGRYDVVVDFMLYSTKDFADRCEILLASCAQYVYLSSYRVFADANIITENTPRLLDSSTDETFLRTNDYSLEKARQEDILAASKRKNWTIVRPSITYSKERFQLVTLEADTVVWRALNKKRVPFPKELLNTNTTMTWAGDVAKMVAGIALVKKAYGEDYNVVSSESRTWGQILEVYKETIGLVPQFVSTNKYVQSLGGGHVYYQVRYDRMFNRVLDNSKILKITGLKQEGFLAPEEGLERELKSFVKEPQYQNFSQERQEYIDGIMDPLITRVRKRLKVKTRLKALKHKLRLRTRARGLKRAAQYYVGRIRRGPIDGALVTLPGYYNYGNMVQRYALQHFLKKNGLKFISYAKDLPIEDADKERLQYTSDFVGRNIWRKQFDSRDRFKSYIVGSDQVWRKWGYDDIFDELGYYFLDFTKDFETNRIAYAASIGQDSLKEADYTDEYIPYAGELARKFSHVSMRELSGVEIVKKEWGVNASHVLDPTMLLRAEDYEKLIEAAPYEMNKPGELFTYCILTNDEKRAMIASISKDVGIQDNGIYLEKSDVLRPVEEWLQNIRDAKLVVTDSFHGMVFCILFNTQFIVLESGTGGAARITTLLGKLGLEERYIVSEKVKSFKISDVKPIDWPKVNAKLEKLRAQSAEWLLKAIASK